MIKIIKEGRKTFTTTCKTCGCEFEYDLGDLKFHTVLCPNCGEKCIHKIFNDQPPYVITPYVDKYSTSVSSPCEDCAWHKQMLMRKEPYVGDSPCDWCTNGNIPTCK